MAPAASSAAIWLGRLKRQGFWVRGVDLKFNEYAETEADDFVVGDLRDQAFCPLNRGSAVHEVYQLAADMGGAGYIFTGEHDADVMHNSAADQPECAGRLPQAAGRAHLLFVVSLHVSGLQSGRPVNPLCAEDSAYPAAPDSEYGWEKLFSERLYLAYRRNYGVQTFIARYHNIFGPYGTWTGGREKAPAAICRKVAIARDSDMRSRYGATACRPAPSSTSENASKARRG